MQNVGRWVSVAAISVPVLREGVRQGSAMATIDKLLQVTPKDMTQLVGLDSRFLEAELRCLKESPLGEPAERAIRRQGSKKVPRLEVVSWTLAAEARRNQSGSRASGADSKGHVIYCTLNQACARRLVEAIARGDAIVNHLEPRSDVSTSSLLDFL